MNFRLPNTKLSYYLMILVISGLIQAVWTESTLAAPPDSKLQENRLAPRIQELTFFSHTLQKSKSFCAVLPENYQSTKENWPALFLLHGRGRNRRSLIDDTSCRKELLKSRAVVILPDGDDGWYLDSPVKTADVYETYTTEVFEIATKHFQLSRDKSHRGITGWSMGGYGAMRYAQNHPDQFRAVATIIGLLDFPRTSLPQGQSYAVPEDRFGHDPQLWHQLNPIQHAEKIRSMSILVLSADEAFDRTMNENFSQELKRQKIPHQFQMLQGGHTFPVVRNSIPFVIRFMNQNLKISSLD